MNWILGGFTKLPLDFFYDGLATPKSQFSFGLCWLTDTASLASDPVSFDCQLQFLNFIVNEAQKTARYVPAL